jgi:tetrahydromethanopterin S-methyltransferase subunit G
VVSDERADLILNTLREIRAEIATIRDRQEELIERVGRVEREVANLHVDFAGMHLRLDNIGRRLDRIERRLDLVDAPGGAAS